MLGNSNFYSALKKQQLNLPEPGPLPQSSGSFWEFTQCKVDIPIVFVADDAFPLSTNCMKPFGFKNASDMERIFDYRLSRFKRIAENGFGIWSNRFKLFSTKAQLKPEKTTIAVMASLALHNMLRTKSSESYTPVGFIDTETNDGIIEGTWREGTAPNLAPLPDMRYGRTSLAGKDIKRKLCEYFNGPGQIPWQWVILVN